ncbi:hypothetical protein HDC35_003192 [Sphingopyxis sp. JAI128]|nr:hypothetical protein [Sphingopyxis sp. JAI128]
MRVSMRAPAFAPFDPRYPSQPGVVRSTFCVWELG